MPSQYKAATEKYYLAWIEHGKAGQSAVAALTLLNLDAKSEYDVTKQLFDCTPAGAIKHVLLLALFDQRPDTHRQAVERLLKPSSVVSNYPILPDSAGTGEFLSIQSFKPTVTPAPFDAILKEGFEQFYFNWGNNAALRLVKKGYLSDAAFSFVLETAASQTMYSYRREAKDTFDLFEGIPAYDPAPESSSDAIPYIPDRKPDDDGTKADRKRRKKQLADIKRWYEANRANFRWQPNKQKYMVDP